MIQNLEPLQCLELLGNNYIGRLAFVFQGNPYIIPITYFYDADEKCILSYAAKGHKIDAMRNYDSVAFQVDEIKSIQEWESVLVHGKFEELEGSTAKNYIRRFAEGVQDTIKKKKGAAPRFIRDFSNRLQKNSMPIMYRISITGMDGKFRTDRIDG